MKEILKVVDKHGFIYEVVVQHSPHHGFSIAYYNDRIIADCQLGKIHEPLGDNDAEWEHYEQSYSEWRDEINSNILISCKNHFNFNPLTQNLKKR